MRVLAQRLAIVAAVIAAADTSGRADSGQTNEERTAVKVNVTDPLTARVTLQFKNARVLDVLSFIAAQAGLKADLTALPTDATVTIELANVTLRTALTAICESGGCSWRYEGSPAALRFEPHVGDSLPGLPALPHRVSLHLSNTPLHNVLRALARMLGVRVAIESTVANATISLNLIDTDTNLILRTLCEVGGCTWQFDQHTRELRIRGRQ